MTDGIDARGRLRAAAVVLRHDGREVLMVQHRRPDRSVHWQLPGGGVERDERPADAALRELREETGLSGAIVRWLFTIPYKHGMSITYLVAADDTVATLGTDPEESASSHRKLVDVAWWCPADLSDNPEIRALRRTLPTVLDQE